MADEPKLVKTTPACRIELDFTFDDPKDAEALRAFARTLVASVHNNLAGFRDVRWSKIIPSEPNFDWQGT